MRSAVALALNEVIAAELMLQLVRPFPGIGVWLSNAFVRPSRIAVALGEEKSNDWGDN